MRPKIQQKAKLQFSVETWMKFYYNPKVITYLGILIEVMKMKKDAVHCWSQKI